MTITYYRSTYLNKFNFIPPDSVPVNSGDHSGLNSGIAQFRRNLLSLEWQFGRTACQIIFHQIPQDSTGFRRNDRIPAGITGGG